MRHEVQKNGFPDGNNIGNAVAQDVTIGVGYSRAKILDSNVAFTSGPAAGEYSVRKVNDQNEKIIVATVAPSETITIALLVGVDEPEQPIVAVKSNKTVGINQPIEKQAPQTDHSKKNIDSIMIILMPLLTLAQMFLVKRFRNELGGMRSINNLAFMYIHKGMITEAKEMLKDNIYSKGATAYEIINYGFCLGLDGDKQKAEKNFEAAQFYSSGSSIRGLIQFYRGILYYNYGDIAAAKNFFREALLASRKKIKRYSGFSELMQPILSANEEIKQLFEE